MKEIFYFKIYQYLILLALIFVGLLSNIISILSLCKIKYKDISVHLRIYLEILNITANSVYLSFLFNINCRNTIENILFLFVIFSHEFWIIFMCFVMYKAICLENVMKLSIIKIMFVFDIIISLISLPVGIVLTYYISSNAGLVTFLSIFLSHYIIIFIIIAYFYYQINKKISKIFIDDINAALKFNKIVSKRIYGYPLTFCLLIMTMIIAIVEQNYKKYSKEIDFAQLLLYAFYALFNSIFYGLTISSLKSFKNLIARGENYKIRQEIFNMLRNQNVIYPRYIYDLLGISEDLIISIPKLNNSI